MSLSAPVRAAAAATVAAVLLVGCSSGDDDAGSAPTVRAVDPPSPQQQVARCMTEQGWDVQYDEGEDSLGYTFVEEQRSAFDAALAACEDSFGDDPVDYAEISADEWRRLYEQETETAQCLRAQGIDVPEIPSEATWVEGFSAADPWTAYGFVGDVSRARWERLNRDCPQP